MAAERPAQTANICPHCHHHNRAGVLVCEKCFRRMVERKDSTTKLVQLSDSHQTTGSFGNIDDNEIDNLVRLRIANAPMSIKIDPHKQTILGRANPQRPRQPDVDLSAFKALERGVSSIHAMIDTHNGDIVIADLGSSNGTFVNGKRLAPHDMQVLHNGDEIRMGNLFARIYFRKDTSLF